MDELQNIPSWVWSLIVYPLVGVIWSQLQNRIKRQDEQITSQQEMITAQGKQISALNLCLTDYVKLTKFDKEIDTLHKINAAMNNNFRADIKEVRADIKHANDRVDTKADKT